MRLSWLLWLPCLTLALPAQAQLLESTQIELQAGLLDHQTGVQTLGLASVETMVDLDAFGLQVGALTTATSTLDNTTAVRVIATRNLRWPVTLGLSAAYASTDGVQSGTATFGLHARYATHWTWVEGNLLLPDHIRESGAFSFSILGGQRLSDNATLSTRLYRLSTDAEDPDTYTIALGLDVDMTDRLGLFIQGFQTVSDDYDIRSTGTRLGLRVGLGQDMQISASLDQVRPADADAALGLTLGWHRSFGGGTAPERMFDAAILPSRFATESF